MASTVMVPSVNIDSDGKTVGRISYVNGVWQAFDTQERWLGNSADCETALNILSTNRLVNVSLTSLDLVELIQVVTDAQESFLEQAKLVQDQEDKEILLDNVDVLDDVLIRLEDALESVPTFSIDENLVSTVRNQLLVESEEVDTVTVYENNRIF